MIINLSSIAGRPNKRQKFLETQLKIKAPQILEKDFLKLNIYWKYSLDFFMGVRWYPSSPNEHIAVVCMPRSQ